MPDLEPVSGDPFSTQLVPISGNPFSSADIASMTHAPDQPNPAQPYLDRLNRFWQPPDLAPAHLPGTQPQDYLRELAQNPDILAKNIEQAQPFAGMAGVTSPKGITAYHGSPHDFDRFDISKIGTGEGAQAYGHGLYFAENPTIAEHYRDTISDAQGTPVQSLMAQALKGRTREEAIKKFREIAADPGMQRSTSYTPRYTAADYAEAANRLEQGEQHGRMYQVAIKADPEHFLDWDKPLSEQSEHVQKALKPFGLKDTDRGEWLHYELYNRLGGNTPEGQVKGAQALRSAGIPGIKYLDQGSRPHPNQAHMDREIDLHQQILDDAKQSRDQRRISEAQAKLDKVKALAQPPKQTSNYVVFDDKLIDIMKKYGLAGLVAAGAYHAKTQPVSHDPFSE